ncbi:uncharacterized protein LOC142181256 [Nicotiana tabacum]|uniref:Uncharacterized protein LOC142181256 n=1 Tax=Nicotiana tabacum TaxID=4097 RepID=A0AC58UL86_TOBAC
MWAAARSYTIVDFEKYMELIKKENTEAHRWLSKIGANQWSKSAFSTLPKCDMLSNNICEIFNHWIQEARDQPILTMLEIIRRKMMCRLQERCEWIKDYDGLVCPRIMDKIEETKEQTLDCEQIEAGNGIWEVHEGLEIYVTKLKEKVCTCRKWDVTGIPCRHGVSAIMTARREPEDFVHPFYHVSTFKKAYSGTIIPIPDQSQWEIAPGDPILPPEASDNKPGRPRKSRKKGIDEPINPNKVRKFDYPHECSNCHEIGHNKKTCKNPSKPRQKRIVQNNGRGANGVSELNKLPTNPRGWERGIEIEINNNSYGRAITRGRGATNLQSMNGRGRGRGRARGMGKQNKHGPCCGIGNWNGIGMSNMNQFVLASQVQPPRPSQIASSATQLGTSQLHTFWRCYFLNSSVSNWTSCPK